MSYWGKCPERNVKSKMLRNVLGCEMLVENVQEGKCVDTTFVMLLKI